MVNVGTELGSTERAAAALSSSVLPPQVEVNRRLRQIRCTTVAIILTVGLGLGIGCAGPHASDGDIVSSVMGWGYFSAWSLSFYPQVYLNWERRSVVGLSFDYTALNFIGFTFYGLFNAALFWSSTMKEEYAREYGASPVKANDVLFSFHAAAISGVTLLQIAIYDRGDQRFSQCCKFSLVVMFFSASSGAAICALPRSPLSVLNFLYCLSLVKLGISSTKYAPQVVLNMKRRSTEGWNIDNVLLDFTGGLLSLAQLLFDSSRTGDWSSIEGDPTKFGLGLFSLVYDNIFMLQHFVLYKKPERNDLRTPMI